MKLCLVKVGKSDACIRPLFTNSVTYMCARVCAKCMCVAMCVAMCVPGILIFH